MTVAVDKFFLADLASFVSGGTPSKQIPRYWGGDTPWVSAKDLKTFRIASSIETLSDEGRIAASLIPTGALLILVRGMSLFKTIPIGIAMREVAINQDIKGLIPNNKVSSKFLAYSLLARKEQLLQMVEAAGHGTGRLNTESLKSLNIYVPSRDEQERIVDFLDNWGAATEITERLILAKECLLDSLREILIGSNEAEPIKLRVLTNELALRNGSRLDRAAIMAVTKEQGIRPMREETIGANITRYKVVPPKGFAYNPMRLNIGSIAMSPFEQDILVSPDYVVFECNASQLLPAYLDHARFTRHWVNHFSAAGNGSVRVRIYYDDLAAFALPVPSVNEQHRIVKLLDAAVSEIDALNRYLEALRQQKRGLMQKLLTGEWRLPLPENRARETASC